MVWINASSLVETILRSRFCSEDSLRDAHNIPKGVSLYSRNFVYNSISGELMDVITQVEIPVYFFTGRYDYTDPFMLTERYFSKIKAPEKHIVWFKDSAHFPSARSRQPLHGRCLACSAVTRRLVGQPEVMARIGCAGITTGLPVIGSQCFAAPTEFSISTGFMNVKLMAHSNRSPVVPASLGWPDGFSINSRSPDNVLVLSQVASGTSL
jgi:hypothetical protein